MNKIIEVKILPDKKIFVKYSDDLEGVLDLSKLSEQENYKEFASMNEFENVVINDKTGDLIINGKIEICKNATYEILKLRAQMKSFGINLDQK